MDAAENMAMSHEHKEADPYFSYYNAKEMVEPGEAIPTTDPMEPEDGQERHENIPPKEVILQPDPHFNHRINKSISSVHVPTNVYDRCEYKLSSWQILQCL